MIECAPVATRVVRRLIEGDEGDLSSEEFMSSYLERSKLGPFPNELEVPSHNILRAVRLLDKYYLVLWDTGRRDTHYKVGYQLMWPGHRILFKGEDLGVPSNQCIDSDDTLRDLIGWLTLKPGDTDEEYFENYTPEQLAFAQSDDAQNMQYDFGPHHEDRYGDYGGAKKKFQDLPGYEHDDEDDEDEA